MKGNWQYALLALILAVSAWYFVSGRERVETWVEVPVQFTGMPEDLVVQQGMVNKIAARVRGPQGLLRNLETKSMAYSLDLSGLEVGTNVVTIHPEELPLTKPFEVVETRPTRLELLVDRMVVRNVPVEPVWEVSLDPDYELSDVRVQPEAVIIRGPEKLVSGIDEAATQTLTVNGTRPVLVEEVLPLDLPDELEARPPKVTVTLRFQVKTKEMSFTVPVQVVDQAPGEVQVRPETVRVVAEMPLPMSQEKDLKRRVTVRLTVSPNMEPGEYALPYRISLPEGSWLVRAEPEKLRVTLRP
jgi:hypothetical protein